LRDMPAIVNIMYVPCLVVEYGASVIAATTILNNSRHSNSAHSPFNPWPGSAFESSSNNRIRRFAEIIENAGIPAPVRWPRGRDIMAACGQLKSAADAQKDQPSQQ